MSTFRDVVARMAVDAEFARHARANPDEVARHYGLTADEADRLRGLAVAEAGEGPAALGARLSKSGIGTGGLAGLLGETPEPDPSFHLGLTDPIDPGLLELDPSFPLDPITPPFTLPPDILIDPDLF